MVPLVAFILVAVVLWAIVAVFLVRIAGDRKGAVRVQGVITGARQFVDRGRTMYCATFEARTPTGEVVHGVSGIAKSWEPTVGKSVSLLWNPKNSEDPLIETGIMPLVPPLLVGGFAMAFTVVSCAILVAVVTQPQTTAKSHVDGEDSHQPTTHVRERRHR